MNDSQWQWIIQALIIISKQINHLEHKVDVLSQHLGAQLPPKLVKTGLDLQAKTKALQAALDAQAQQPTKKENS